MSDNKTKDYNDVLMRNKAPANVTGIIESLPTDPIIEKNNFNDKMCDEIVTETILQIMYEPKMK